MSGYPTSYRPRQSPALRWVIGLVVLPALAGISASGQGNPSLAATRWQLGWHGGTSTYIGDQEAMRLDQPALGAFAGGELVHQFTAAVGLGVAAQVVRNPRLDEPDSYRSTLSALFRITQPGSRRLSPYVQAGILYIIGASRGGSGPLAGAGFNVRVTRTFSIYAEGNLHLVYPGNVLDDSQTADHFDGLGLVGVGFRITDLRGFFGRRPPLDIRAIRHSPAPEQDFPVRFDADLNFDEPDTRIVWTFGDGESRTGNPVQHTFRKSGIHEVVATASNRSGTAIRYLILDITPKPPAVVVSPARRDTVETTPRRNPPVRPERENTPPLTAPVEERPETETEPMSASPDPPARELEPLPFSGYTWVVGSPTRLSEARTLAQAYLADGIRPLIFSQIAGGVTRYRVTLGQYGNRSLAQRERSTLPARVPRDTWLTYVDAQVPLPLSAEQATATPLQREPVTARATPQPTVDTQPARFTWVVASPSSSTAAETLAEQLHAEGFDAVVRSSRIDGTTRHRVTIGGYASRSDAQAGRENLPAAYRGDAWLLALQSDR